MYEFIQGVWIKRTPHPLRGRLTTVGLYLNYAERDVLVYQHMLVRKIRIFTKEWPIDFSWYYDLGARVQIAVNVGVVMVLLIVALWLVRCVWRCMCCKRPRAVEADEKKNQ